MIGEQRREEPVRAGGGPDADRSCAEREAIPRGGKERRDDCKQSVDAEDMHVDRPENEEPESHGDGSAHGRPARHLVQRAESPWQQ